MSERERAPDAIPVWDAPLEAANDERERLALQALARGDAVDAFAWLGPHTADDGVVRVRALIPGADALGLLDGNGKLVARMRAHPEAEGVFEGELKTAMDYRLRIVWPDTVQEIDDPYAFGPVLDEAWLQGMAEGDGAALRTALGAHHSRVGTVDGVRFAVWAPHARRVALVGDFNGWDGRRHPLRLHRQAGVWELFVPGLRGGEHYQYEILDADGTPLPRKADPVARHSTCAPDTASVVPGASDFVWHDTAWLAQREARAGAAQPMSIYEVHAGSWRHDAHGQPLQWDALAAHLIPYVREMGFTHLELLPIAEYPFGGSWGYQPLGLYAPTARHGDADGFARFVDACHQAGIGVILDWVGAHFPDDAHGLQRFDGTALYEHADPREGVHREWNTLIYNYGRAEVVAYLIGSALEWIERFHVDGLRVDAVAAMLYRDYGRNEGEWVPNAQGGRENLEAIAFLRRLNAEIAQRFPGVRVMAEESTAWPGVTAPLEQGGLGFSHKWNMGWTHDTLSYMRRDPSHRQHHHSEMSFGLMHAARPQPSPAPPQRDELRPDVCVLRALRAAAVARRSGARQGLAAGADARRQLAALRQPARLPGLHVGAPGTQAAVHGRRIRAMAGLGPRPRAGLGAGAARRAPRRGAVDRRPQPPAARAAGAVPQRPRRRRLRMERGRRPAQQRVRLRAPRPRRRRAAAAGGEQLHPRRAPRLPPRRAARRAMARTAQHRQRPLRRFQPGQRRRLAHRRASDAQTRAIAGADPAAAVHPLVASGVLT
jgi:1,4-alpha-glucan branching enzyme